MAAFTLEAELERWACEEGGSIGCRLSLTSLLANPDSNRIDWLAIQCCGFVQQLSSKFSLPSFSKWHVTTPPAGSGTALHDETFSDDDSRSCVLNSQPQVVAAGISLAPGQSVSFDTSVQLPEGLPPTFDGISVRYTYIIILTLRTMSPPSRFSRAWSRSPDYTLRLPLRVLAGGVSEVPVPLALAAAERAAGLSSRVPPLRCEILCDEIVPRASHEEIHGAGSSMHEAQEASSEGWSDEEDETASHSHRGRSMRQRDAHIPIASWRSFCVRQDTTAIAKVDLASLQCCVGGVLRGAIELEQRNGTPGWSSAVCERLILSLQLEESIVNSRGGPGSLAGSHVIQRQEIHTRHLRRTTFEVVLPAHVPPQLTTAEVSLTWSLAFTFELAHLDASSHGVSRKPQQLDWRLPLEVYAARFPADIPVIEQPQHGTLDVPIT